MSLYDDASLAMIPSAYKDGKLYSIKPSDGSGDFTFSRGSNLAATRVDVNGLIEKGRENLLLQSNSFNTTWTKQNTTLTDGQSGYDGSSDAWRVEATTTATTRLLQSSSISANTLVTMSVYAKVGNVDFIKFNLSTSGVNSIVTFDLTDGTTYSSNAIDTNWESVGSGWVRISASFINSNAIIQPRIEVRSQYNSASCDAGSFVYIQDAQLELGLVATDYIETTTTTAQAGILEDMPRLDYSGSCPSLLLEPQRSNLITQSEYFGGHTLINVSSTANATTSPEGVENASKIIESSSFGEQSGYLQASCTTSTDYTISIFAKANTRDYFFLRFGAASSVFTNSYAWFDLSNGTKGTIESGITADIEDYGNGWYRLIATRTSAATAFGRFFWGLADANGSTSYTGDGSSSVYTYGFQVEEGSYPTSYIPCYGTSQTRLKDSMSTTFSSSLTSGGEVSVLFDIDGAYNSDSNSTGDNLAFIFSNDDRIIWNQNSNGFHRIEINVEGRTEYIYLTTSVDRVDRAKICIVVTASTYAMYVNGSLETSGSFTGTGNWTSADSFTNSMTNAIAVVPMQQLLYFPTALTSSECIALTTL